MSIFKAGQKIGQKIGQGAVKRNVKIKIYLELFYFCATQPTLTLAGQQLPNLKSQEVTALYLPNKKMTLKKLEGGGAY